MYSSFGSDPTIIYSIIEGGYGGVGNLDVDPLLQPLGNYGGVTQTMPISANSPAVDAGATGDGIPGEDQRGFSRDSLPDIGATEFQFSTLQTDFSGIASLGEDVTANVFTDTSNPSYQWYLGQRGDTSSPMDGATNRDFATGGLSESVEFWVRVIDGENTYDSDTLTVNMRATYEEWLDYYSITGLDREPEATPAGDGIANLVKFALGLKAGTPSKMSDRMRYYIDSETSEFVAEYDLSKVPSDLNIDFEGSIDDLSDWDSSNVSKEKLSEDLNTETWEVRPSASGAESFIRLKVSK